MKIPAFIFQISGCRSLAWGWGNLAPEAGGTAGGIPGEPLEGSRGNRWGDPGGTGPGHRYYRPFKKLYKNPLGKPSSGTMILGPNPKQCIV